jgi:hypothetical protein
MGALITTSHPISEAPPSPAPNEVPAALPAVRPIRLRRQLGTFAFDLGVPIALYYLLHSLGVSNLLALAICAVLPATSVAHQLVTRHRTDGVGLVVVVTVAVTIALSVAIQSPRFLLARDGLVTGVWGLWFVASAAARRPAAFILARPLMEGRRFFAAGSWDAVWESEPRFRRIWRVATVMWGVGLLVDAAVRVIISYTLPVDVVPGLGAALYPVTFVVVQIVTNTYYNVAGLYAILGARWVRPQNGRRSAA